MTVAPIRLFESRTILLKVESVAGADAGPDGATNAMRTMEGSCTIEADQLDRKYDKAYLGADPFVLIGKRATVEVDIDVIGAAVVGDAAPCGPMLRTCAMAETLVASTSASYNGISSAFETATIYFYWAGYLFKVTYGIGTPDFDFTAKQWGKAHIKYTGVIALAGPTETAAPAVDLSAFQLPQAVETETFALNCNSVALNATSFKLSMGNDVKIYEGSEARQVSVPTRKATGSFTFFADQLAVFNGWALANAHSQVPLYAEIGSVAGKIARVTCANVQLMYPKPTSIDGAAGFEVPFTSIPSDSGNDDLVLKFT